MVDLQLTEREADALSYAARVATGDAKGEEAKILTTALETYRTEGTLATAYEKLRASRRLFE